MKKTAVILVLISALMLSACSGALPAQPTEAVTEPQMQTTQATEPETQPSGTEPETQPSETEPEAVEAEIPASYSEILDAYAQAALEWWNGATLAQNGLNYVAADIFGDNSRENLGYLISDLDGDGVQELVIGATEAVTDEFYGRLMLELYTLGSDGSAVNVFSATERSRYYSLGDNRFAYHGANSAFESVDTTVALENGGLTDLGYPTDSKDYAPLPLEPIGSLIPAEPALELPILEEINEITRVGTTGAFMTAVQAAAKLLDWASGTGLAPEEVKDATVLWLQNQGNDAQAAFREKMEQVDNAVKMLMEDGAEDLLASAGCENTGYPWSEYPMAMIQAIMEAAGVRE